MNINDALGCIYWAGDVDKGGGSADLGTTTIHPTSRGGFASVQEGLKALNAIEETVRDLHVGAHLLVWENLNGDVNHYPCTVEDMDGKYNYSSRLL
jgi:hypothetical protein